MFLGFLIYESLYQFIYLLLILVQEIKQNIVLELNVSFFVSHFSLQYQVAQIPFLQKPVKKLSECKFAAYDFLSVSFLGFEQRRNVAGSGNELYLGEIKFSGLITWTVIFFAQILNIFVKRRADKLSDDFLGYVSANVLLIIAFIMLF